MNLTISSEFIRCPRCGGSLNLDNEDLACVTCSTRFPHCEGIPVLSQETGYHFMRPSPEELARTFERMDREGFEAGLDALFREVSDEDARTFQTYMLKEVRSAWRVLLPSLAGKTVLDCGSGWGNLSVGMARSAERVVGLDLSLQRVRFAARRAKHERLDNLSFITGGDGQRLPFADGTFDIAILNGVLEWIPTSAAWDGDPRSVQVKFLRELARVTKPDGMVCIAIENRFGFKYWLRARDEHTQIRYITLLPRWVANMVSQRRRSQPYREYTPSLSDCHKIASEGGFANSKVWIPHGDYRNYDTLVPAHSPRALAHATRSRRRPVRWMGKVVSHIPQLANAYIILAGKKPQEPNTACWQRMASAGGRYAVQSDQAIRVLGTGSIVVFARDTQTDAHVVVKLPLEPHALASCQQTVANIEALLADSYTPVWFRSLLPRPLGTYIEGRETAFIQQQIPGATGAELAGIRREHTPLTEKATALLTRWHKETALPTVLTTELYQTTVTPLIAHGIKMLSILDRARAEKIEQTLRTTFTGRTLALVQFHGDFWLKNIIFDELSGEITGIIDWDRSALRGLPLFDLMHLLHMSRRLKQNSGLHSAISTLSEELETGAAANYRTAVGLSIEDAQALLAVYALFRISDEAVIMKETDATLIESLLSKATPKP